VFLLFIAFWEFILVYSSMILPAAWVISAASAADPPHRLWRDALLLLGWLFPYTVYLVLILIAIGHR